MKPYSFDYVAPSSLEDALRLLDAHGGDAKIIAGGQSLIPIMNLRLAAPSVLIDIAGIASLRGIERLADGSISAGAVTPHRHFERSSLIAESLPIVHAAMPWVAHAQIRNRGTLGGSLCHADPAAEWPALCLACEAEMTLVSSRGERVVPAEDFSLGVYETATAPDEILTSVRFAAWPSNRRWGFQEVSRRRGDFAIIGIACLIDVDAAGVCQWARLVVFGAGERPLLLTRAAQSLVGNIVNGAAIQAASETARAEVEPRDDLHASAEYRRELIEVLTRRALMQAMSIGAFEQEGKLA